MRKTSLAVAVLLASAGTAAAHSGHGAGTGFTYGVAHPLLGLDHLLAMVAVGLWAAQIGGRALWLIPAAFVSVMAAGGAMAVAGIDLPLVEAGILGSVLVLGLLVALAPRLPFWAPAAIVGLFAIFHGHAHGTEMPENAAGLAYGLGLVLATAVLHAAGIGLGIGATRHSALVLRAGGAVIAAVGGALFLAA